MAGEMPQSLRADALENRLEILSAARRLFASQGIGVTMRDVARAAGVGPATLYRRFPTKKHLVNEAFADELRECREIVAQGSADVDPWRGLCAIVERIGVLNARNHGFVEAFAAEYPELDAFVAHRAELLAHLRGLCGRAAAAGTLRHDFAFDDFVLVLLAGRGLSTLPARQREAAARRFAVLALDALRA